MKKKLLFAAMAVISLTGFGQTVWNVGNDATNFPISSGIATGTEKTIDGLTIVAGGTNVANMGQVEANGKTFTSPTTSTEYTFVNRFKFNGGGYSGASVTDATPSVFVPTQRYLKINVSGNSTIYCIGISGNNSSERKIFVTDGTKVIGTMNFPIDTSVSPSVAILSEGTVTYTGAATTLYVYCNSAVNLYYLSATSVSSTGLSSPNANKTIQSVQYFDAIGKQLQQNATGLVIKKITYDDGTTASEKAFIKAK